VGGYCVCGFYSLSHVLREYNVLETGSVLSWKGGAAPAEFGPTKRTNLNHQTSYNIKQLKLLNYTYPSLIIKLFIFI
jgi:hypothetical protein